LHGFKDHSFASDTILADNNIRPLAGVASSRSGHPEAPTKKKEATTMGILLSANYTRGIADGLMIEFMSLYFVISKLAIHFDD